MTSIHSVFVSTHASVTTPEVFLNSLSSSLESPTPHPFPCPHFVNILAVAVILARRGQKNARLAFPFYVRGVV